MSIISSENLSYISTSEKIKDEIIRNKFSAGTKLMPLRALAQKYRVSYVTAQKAVQVLQDQGLLNARKGKGIFVNNCKEPGINENQNFRHLSKIKKVAIILPPWIHDQGKAAIYSIMSGFIGICQEHKWTTETIIKTTGDLTWKECRELCEKEFDAIFLPSPSPNDIVSVIQFQHKGIKVVTSGRGFPQISLKPVISNIKGICDKVVEYAYNQNKINFLMLGYNKKGSIIIDSISEEFKNDFYAALDHQKLEHNLLLIEDVLSSDGNEVPLAELALKKNPQANCIICLSERVFPAIEKLANEGFWDLSDPPLIINCVGDYGYNPRNVGPFKLVTIRRPYDKIGKTVAYRLIKQSDGDLSSERDLEIELIVPD